MTTLCASTCATTPGWSTFRAAAGALPTPGTATDELTGRFGRPPIVVELARHLGVGEEAVLDARGALAAHSPPSLDEPISEDSQPVTRAPHGRAPPQRCRGSAHGQSGRRLRLFDLVASVTIP